MTLAPVAERPAPVLPAPVATAADPRGPVRPGATEPSAPTALPAVTVDVVLAPGAAGPTLQDLADAAQQIRVLAGAGWRTAAGAVLGGLAVRAWGPSALPLVALLVLAPAAALLMSRRSPRFAAPLALGLPGPVRRRLTADLVRRRPVPAELRPVAADLVRRTGGRFSFPRRVSTGVLLTALAATTGNDLLPLAVGTVCTVGGLGATRRERFLGRRVDLLDR